ncbi:MAG: hypothetical protein DDT26_02740 [Dehalococcoidia bacterium]|nr:hypothetical protein [Chloroflexota bacterium]
MSVVMDEEIKRWTARRKSALVQQIIQLRPLLERLQRLTARVDDTVAALGSDVMDLALEGYADVALEGYALVKVSGRAQGLDELRRELGSRFAKTRRKELTPREAPATGSATGRGRHAPRLGRPRARWDGKP